MEMWLVVIVCLEHRGVFQEGTWRSWRDPRGVRLLGPGVGGLCLLVSVLSPFLGGNQIPFVSVAIILVVILLTVCLHNI